MSESIEIWESTTEGRISLEVPGERGRPRRISVVGKGKRIRLTGDERELVEELVREQQNNPFRNGMLYQVNAEAPGSPDELSDEDLGALFEFTGEDFESAVSELSEVNIRRLKDMTVPKDASRSQMEFIDNLIAERFAIGGDTPTYREMQADRS